MVAIQALSIAMLNAVGRPDVAFRFRLVTTVITVGGFVLAVRFGIVAVAAAYVIPGYLLLPLNLIWMQHYAGIGIRAYLARLRGVAAATLVMALVMISGRSLLGEREPWVLLVALCSVSARSPSSAPCRYFDCGADGRCPAFRQAGGSRGRRRRAPGDQ